MDIHSYITGFVEGEGCFSVSFSRRPKLLTNIEVRPSFSVSQHERSLGVLQMIHSVFGCGTIRYSRSDQNYKYEVRSINDLLRVVIPFFEAYPLFGAKGDDFIKFKQVCEAVGNCQHRDPETLEQIISLSY
jgi:hypothetical protein